MKRASALIVLSLLLTMLLAVPVMAASSLKVEQTSPRDKATGQSVDNMGVKVYFNKDVYSKSKTVRKANADRCQLYDNKGRKISTKVAFSSDEKRVMLVVANTTGKHKAKIKSQTKYTLRIKSGFASADGSTMSAYSMSFTTLNQRSSMYISFGMMGVMVVGMVFFTMREQKRQAKREREAREGYVPINPYKEAKRTGKSVEEIVAREQERKERIEEQLAKQRKKEQARAEKEAEKEAEKDYMRVSRPRPISEAGSTYKYVKPVKKSKSTNPKNQSGKQRNKKKK